MKIFGDYEVEHGLGKGTLGRSLKIKRNDKHYVAKQVTIEDI